MTSTVSTCTAVLSPFFALNDQRPRSRVLVRSLSDGDSVVMSPDSVDFSGASWVKRKDVNVVAYDNLEKQNTQIIHEELEPLWDDGYMTPTLIDFSQIAEDFVRHDGGPPRWFCPVSCGMPLKDSPILLYLPGLDGTGLGLVFHEKSLGKVYHVQCLHIPAWDRTPLEDLIQIVEATVRIEHALSPNKPIYLLGDSFGGCLALAVAARNPTLDLILILANPATSFERSYLQPLFPFLKVVPEESYGMLPYILCPFMGNQMKIATVLSGSTNHPPSLWQFFGSLSESLALFSGMTRVLPQDTLTWRLDLVKSGAAYANSRLHAIKADVLVLASGKDNLLPSKDEARRLSRLLKNCNIRVFEDNGHTILLESGVNVLEAIKVTYRYRRSSKHDIIKDFLPPSMTDIETTMVQNWWYRLSVGAAMFSTMEDGTIVRGLAGVPDEGPVLIVGNHLLWAFECLPLVMGFLREKKIRICGMAHPILFPQDLDDECFLTSFLDMLRLLGPVPVTGRNLFKVLSEKSHVLLYPGGAREGFHRKGETYKLFWPEKEEFVRMAMKLGATIVPFGAIGEDDILELLIDYDEMMKIPFFNWMVEEFNKGTPNIREGMDGEVSKQPFYCPIFLPKVPGRFYFLFGKPIRTKGKESMLDDKDYVRELYLQIKDDVEKSIAYLMKKRDEDPYRGFVDRLVYQTTYGLPLDKIPSFKP